MIRRTYTASRYLGLQGFLSHSIMYYGFYSNGTVDTLFGTKYSIPFAYFLTLLFCYIVTFVIISLKYVIKLIWLNDSICNLIECNDNFFLELYLLIENLMLKHVEKCTIYIPIKYFVDGTSAYLHQKLLLYNQHRFIKN